MSISVKNLVKTYGTQRAVDGISFEIHPGQIVGFIGPNGAGKSTTMKVITGFLSDFEGDVLVNDIDVRLNSIEAKKIIGYLPEHNPLYPEMYVQEYISFVAQMYGLKDNLKERVNEVIQHVGLTKEQHKKIGMLSKGYRQRVGLASVLIHNPQVLILDEPTTGLDPNQLIDIRNLIASIGKTKTVLLSTHIMQEVEAICDKIIIINNGKIVAEGNPEEVKHLSSNIGVLSLEFLQECPEDLLISIPNVEKVVKKSNTQWLVYPSKNEDVRQSIFSFAVDNNLTIISMQIQENSLETAFNDLTKTI